MSSILHLFPSGISSYTILSMSFAVISSSLIFLVRGRILLTLLPVTHLVSFMIVFKRNVGVIFFDFSICWRNDKNLFISIFFKCICSDTRYLWVWTGASYIILNDIVQEFSSLMVSWHNRSQMGEPVKFELNILFVSNLVFGWANMNSCMRFIIYQ